ncbi:uncharacterized protein LOC144339910 isoform X2 [Macaca mulatta]
MVERNNIFYSSTPSRSIYGALLCGRPYPRGGKEKSGHMIANLSSKVTVPFCICTAIIESSCCSTSLPAFAIVGVSDFDHSNREL